MSDPMLFEYLLYTKQSDLHDTSTQLYSDALAELNDLGQHTASLAIIEKSKNVELDKLVMGGIA